MTEQKKIPFLDLVTPHQELKEELQHVFETVLGSAGFIGGPMVEGFEHEFAAFCETELCRCQQWHRCAAIRSDGGGRRPGIPLSTVPNTFIATTEAISQAGRGRISSISTSARTTWTRKSSANIWRSSARSNRLRATDARRNPERPVSAIVPVHLYGQTADMDPDPGAGGALQT